MEYDIEALCKKFCLPKDQTPDFIHTIHMSEKDKVKFLEALRDVKFQQITWMIRWGWQPPKDWEHVFIGNGVDM